MQCPMILPLALKADVYKRQAMTFVDELAVVGTNVGEISAILEAPELERPAAETKLNGLGTA